MRQFDIASMQQRIEQHPSVARALVHIDASARFMAERDYTSTNPAMSATRRPLVVGLWIMVALGAITLIWGALAPIDSAVVAHGRVVLKSHKKTVQHLEGGVIKEILVQEGEHVAKGQPLIRLNNASAKANAMVLENNSFTALASHERLIAQRDQQEQVDFSPELQSQAAKSPELQEILDNQARLFTAEREAQQAKRGTLEQRVMQAEEQIEGLAAQNNAAKAQIALYEEEIATVEKLLRRGFATKPRLLSLKREREALLGQQGQYQAESAKAVEALAEAKLQAVGLEQEFSTKNAEDVHTIQQTVTESREKLTAATDINGRGVLVAPVAGIVTGLQHHTTGGVIAPGAPILDIIPQNERLVIEARVQPRDIDQVHEGMKANVSLTAYNMRNMPKLPGKVILVSADAFTEEHAAQPTSYYLAQVEVDKAAMDRLKTPLALYPSMPADVLMRTGSRSFLTYLFQPITDSMDSAFREE